MTTTKRQRKMSYRLYVTVNLYVLQNFVLTRHFSTVLPLERSRPSTPRITIAQEPTGSFPRPSFLAPWFDLLVQRVQDIRNLARCQDVFVQNKQVLYWPNSRRFQHSETIWIKLLIKH